MKPKGDVIAEDRDRYDEAKLGLRFVQKSYTADKLFADIVAKEGDVLLDDLRKERPDLSEEQLRAARWHTPEGARLFSLKRRFGHMTGQEAGAALIREMALARVGARDFQTLLHDTAKRLGGGDVQAGLEIAKGRAKSLVTCAREEASERGERPLI